MSKGRTFTPEFKAQIVLRVLTGTQSIAEVCREHQLKDSQFYYWKDQFLHNAAQAFPHDDGHRPAGWQMEKEQSITPSGKQKGRVGDGSALRISRCVIPKSDKLMPAWPDAGRVLCILSNAPVLIDRLSERCANASCYPSANQTLLAALRQKSTA